MTRYYCRRTAICRGAVLGGFLEEQDNNGDAGNAKAPIMVASKVSRACYGVNSRRPFDELIHLEGDKVWAAHEGIWMSTNQMTWYLKRVGSAFNPHWRSQYYIPQIILHETNL